MTRVQFITTPGGEDMAVLPRADYERLVEAAEDSADIRAADAIRARLDAGEDEALPAAMAEQLLSGANAVRVWREYRGLRASALAEAAGISSSYLSQIESGRREGTLSTMARIAGALGVEVDDLIA